MTFAKGILAALALAAAVGQASATELEHWPAPAARQLNALIEANANKGAYAVFDMDNTSYRYDLEESLLPYLEMKGVLTRDRLDPSLKLIPFKDQAGLLLASPVEGNRTVVEHAPETQLLESKNG